MEQLLTTKEVAEIFRVDSRTILYNFIPRGLKYFKIGQKDFRFSKKDIEDFMEKQKDQKQKTMFVDTRTEQQKRMNKKLKVI